MMNQVTNQSRSGQIPDDAICLAVSLDEEVGALVEVERLGETYRAILTERRTIIRADENTGTVTDTPVALLEIRGYHIHHLAEAGRNILSRARTYIGRACSAFQSFLDYLPIPRQQLSYNDLGSHGGDVFQRQMLEAMRTLTNEVVQLRGQVDSLTADNKMLCTEMRNLSSINSKQNIKIDRLTADKKKLCTEINRLKTENGNSKLNRALNENKEPSSKDDRHKSDPDSDRSSRMSVPEAALKGALTGAVIGAPLGPQGMAIGGAIGAGVGVGTALLDRL